MNYNKYSSFCKSLDQKGNEKGWEWKYYSSNDMGQCVIKHIHLEYSPIAPQFVPYPLP
jgi:hypothetical protein